MKVKIKKIKMLMNKLFKIIFNKLENTQDRLKLKKNNYICLLKIIYIFNDIYFFYILIFIQIIEIDK